MSGLSFHRANGLVVTGVCLCVLAMDFEFILRVAERRIKAALGKADAGKVLFTQMC